MVRLTEHELTEHGVKAVCLYRPLIMKYVIIVRPTGVNGGPYMVSYHDDQPSGNDIADAAALFAEEFWNG